MTPRTRTTAEPYVPAEADLDTLRIAAQGCRGCELYRHATQAVFGEGSPAAAMVLVGEQPGDREDLDGHPFIGPAGRLLDRALAEAGIDRDTVYVTNAVKHFKFEQRGKRRIHKQPSRTEVVACAPWLTAELELIRPALVVCLGAVAAKALLGPSFTLSERRGELLEAAGRPVIATVHPSSVLRSPERAPAYAEFVEDLRKVAVAAESSARGRPDA